LVKKVLATTLPKTKTPIVNQTKPTLHNRSLVASHGVRPGSGSGLF